MKAGDTTVRALAVLDILKRDTDEDHIMSMPELIDALENEKEITCDRRTVYDAIRALKSSGYKIEYVRKGKQGYYLKHDFTPSEVLFLIDAIQNSPSLSLNQSNRLKGIVAECLSDYQLDYLDTITPPNPSKTDNNDVLSNIEILLKAIHEQVPVTFRYFDTNLQKNRVYRHEGKIYRVDPYAIVSNNARYYCIAFNEERSDFSIYRIDKMEQVNRLKESVDHKMFDLNTFLGSTFDMYSGEAETITCDFDKNMSAILFDQFGTDKIILSREDDHTFRASIITTITPTLIAWLLQFEERLTIIKPESLKKNMAELGERLQRKYGGQNHVGR